MSTFILGVLGLNLKTVDCNGLMMDIKEKATKVLGLLLKNQDPFRFYKVGPSHDQSMIMGAFESQRDSMINIHIKLSTGPTI